MENVLGWLNYIDDAALQSPSLEDIFRIAPRSDEVAALDLPVGMRNHFMAKHLNALLSKEEYLKSAGCRKKLRAMLDEMLTKFQGRVRTSFDNYMENMSLVAGLSEKKEKLKWYL